MGRPIITSSLILVILCIQVNQLSYTFARIVPLHLPSTAGAPYTISTERSISSGPLEDTLAQSTAPTIQLECPALNAGARSELVPETLVLTRSTRHLLSHLNSLHGSEREQIINLICLFARTTNPSPESSFRVRTHQKRVRTSDDFREVENRGNREILDTSRSVAQKVRSSNKRWARPLVNRDFRTRDLSTKLPLQSLPERQEGKSKDAVSVIRAVANHSVPGSEDNLLQQWNGDWNEFQNLMTIRKQRAAVPKGHITNLDNALQTVMNQPKIKPKPQTNTQSIPTSQYLMQLLKQSRRPGAKPFRFQVAPNPVYPDANSSPIDTNSDAQTHSFSNYAT